MAKRMKLSELEGERLQVVGRGALEGERLQVVGRGALEGERLQVVGRGTLGRGRKRRVKMGELERERGRRVVEKRQLVGQRLQGMTSAAEDLTVTHDAARMVKLAEDLKRIATDETLSTHERQRLYEDCLQGYRYVQEKVARNGISLLSHQNGNVEEQLRKLLKEELGNYFEKASEKDRSSSSRSGGVRDSKSDTDVIDVKTPDPSQMKKQKAMATPGSASSFHTPSLILDDDDDDNKDDDDDDDPQATPAKKEAKAILEASGVAQSPSTGRIRFPRPAEGTPSTYPDNAYIPAKRGYAETTYNRAMGYLFNPKPSKEPAYSGFDTVLFNMYKYIKTAPEYASWKKTFPNLKSTAEKFE